MTEEGIDPIPVSVANFGGHNCENEGSNDMIVAKRSVPLPIMLQNGVGDGTEPGPSSGLGLSSSTRELSSGECGDSSAEIAASVGSPSRGLEEAADHLGPLDSQPTLGDTISRDSLSVEVQWPAESDDNLLDLAIQRHAD